MRHTLIFLLFMGLSGQSLPAAALSDAPLRVLTSYIENNPRCGEQITEWHQKNGTRVLNGELSRDFFYRVLGFINWGECGRPFFKPVFIELQKAWKIYTKGLVTESEYEAKEAELIDLLFAALRASNEGEGEALVKRYEQRIAAKLFRLEPERQYFNCTYFGEQAKCAD